MLAGRFNTFSQPVFPGAVLWPNFLRVGRSKPPQIWGRPTFSLSLQYVVCFESRGPFERRFGAAPSYLTNLCVPVATNTSRRYRRSATYGDLLVHRTRTVTHGPRSFAVSGPTVWNTLPSTLRVSTTLGQFQSGVKTILFRLAYGT